MAAKNGSNSGRSSGLPLTLVMNLHAERADLLHRALAFAHAGVGRGDRRLGDETGKLIGMLGAEFRQAVVGNLRDLFDLFGLDESRDRRKRERDDLAVIRK